MVQIKPTKTKETLRVSYSELKEFPLYLSLHNLQLRLGQKKKKKKVCKRTMWLSKPTWKTRKAVGDICISGIVAIISNWTGYWCWGALGTVMTSRTPVASLSSIIWCGRPCPGEAVVSSTTQTWCTTLPKECTEWAWFNGKDHTCLCLSPHTHNKNLCLRNSISTLYV